MTEYNFLLIRIAGITFRIYTQHVFNANTFHSKLHPFIVSESGEDVIDLKYYFSLPAVTKHQSNSLVYYRPPWRIYCVDDVYIYEGLGGNVHNSVYQVGKIYFEKKKIEIYFPDTNFIERGNLETITLIPTDQIILAPILAERQACLIHSAGLIFNGAGFLFVGHSEAGKSTMVKLLRDESEILCDDRIILRRWPDGIKIHGTWSHGEIPDVSPASAPLRALLFLEKAPHNALVPMTPGEVARALPQYVIKALAGRDWWLKTLDLVEHVAREVPAYRVQFDKSGAIKELLRQL